MVDVPRNVLWEKLDLEDRVVLLANDLDKLETQQQRVGERLGKIMAVCVSILVSLVTSSILLLINLRAGGP